MAKWRMEHTHIFVDDKEITDSVTGFKIDALVDGAVSIELEVVPEALTFEGTDLNVTVAPQHDVAIVREMDSLPGYDLDESIGVFVEKDGEYYLATPRNIRLCYGVGASVTDAMDDLRQGLRDYYGWLHGQGNEMWAAHRADLDEFRRLGIKKREGGL